MIWYNQHYCGNRWLSQMVPPDRPASINPPVLTSSGIIQIFDNNKHFQGIVLIDRLRHPPGKALPGGKVDYGESTEVAFRREIREEVNLTDLYDVRQFHTYSDPRRDPRFHAVDVVYTAKSNKRPRAADDAKEAYVVPLNEIPWNELAFDHAQILADFINAQRIYNQT